MSFSKSSSLHYKIAYLGLFAILLLTFGPVISQVQAVLLLNNPVAAQMSHHKSMAHQAIDKVTTALTDEQPTQNSSKSHHFMSLCGYCDLVHHSPIIIIYTPVIIQAPPLQLAISPLYLVDYRSPSYCRALSRAPPFKLTIAITS